MTHIKRSFIPFIHVHLRIKNKKKNEVKKISVQSISNLCNCCIMKKKHNVCWFWFLFSLFLFSFILIYVVQSSKRHIKRPPKLSMFQRGVKQMRVVLNEKSTTIFEILFFLLLFLFILIDSSHTSDRAHSYANSMHSPTRFCLFFFFGSTLT